METFLTVPAGVRSLGVPLERASTNALDSRAARGHPDVERVRYPGLPDDPGHERAATQMDGFGAMVAFEVRGGAAPAEATAKATRLIVGADQPRRHRDDHGAPRPLGRRGRPLSPGLIRLSVGCEHVDDLWADLVHALHIGSLVR